ncbi:MAG: hypothetical protein ABFD79_17850 [Phycisphaerales bacterium]
MINPFQKRATEFHNEVESFLPLISPDPIKYFLMQGDYADSLFSKLVVIIGTPGSGKTTMARLFEYPTLHSLLLNHDTSSYAQLITIMRECKAVDMSVPCMVGCRLPLETDYRDIWELDYNEELKCRLLTTLVQSRAVLGWIRNLTSVGINITQIKIVPRKDAESSMPLIGGATSNAIRSKARYVENSLYKVVTALIPKSVDDIIDKSIDGYNPLDVIDYIEIASDLYSKSPIRLKPLVIFDDAHLLHVNQYEYLRRWLMRRELRVARWIFTRLDVLSPKKALETVTREPLKSDLPGITKSREVIEISIQGRIAEGTRNTSRKSFHGIAKDMSERYIKSMAVFSQKNLNSLADLLQEDPRPLSDVKINEIQNNAISEKDKLKIKDKEFNWIVGEVERYLLSSNKKDNNQDVKWSMVKILLHRLVNKTSQRLLFDLEDTPIELKADSSLYNGACIHLLHKYERPYYYGFDDLCDASSENIEQFLHLSSIFVDYARSLIIQAKSPIISSVRQHKLLTKKAGEIVDEWDFPECNQVRKLTEEIAKACIDMSMQPNSPLGSGANAVGILQEDFEQLSDTYPDLARVLHFAIAYNALIIVPRYTCKNKEWCLFELGGMVILKHGLTLKRGGFVEQNVARLASWLKG